MIPLRRKSARPAEAGITSNADEFYPDSGVEAIKRLPGMSIEFQIDWKVLRFSSIENQGFTTFSPRLFPWKTNSGWEKQDPHEVQVD